MSYSEYHDYPNRTLCAVLSDLRSMDKTKNYSYLAGLIEEIQWYANRMEANLDDKNDLLAISKKKSEAKEHLRKIELDIRNAQAKLDRVKAKDNEL